MTIFLSFTRWKEKENAKFTLGVSPMNLLSNPLISYRITFPIDLFDGDRLTKPIYMLSSWLHNSTVVVYLCRRERRKAIRTPYFNSLSVRSCNGEGKSLALAVSSAIPAQDLSSQLTFFRFALNYHRRMWLFFTESRSILNKSKMCQWSILDGDPFRVSIGRSNS